MAIKEFIDAVGFLIESRSFLEVWYGIFREFSCHILKKKIKLNLMKTLEKIRQFEWKHHNLILLVVSIVIAYYILRFRPIVSLLHGLDYLGYYAAFISGMMFSYALTVTPAVAVLYNLGQQFNPLLIAFVGAFGSLIGDYLIFRFVRDTLMKEIKLLSNEIDTLADPVSSLVFTKKVRIILWRRVSRSRVWKLMIPVIAGLIIASPLPDELAVAMFGAVKYDVKKFILLSYCFNFLGILAITSLPSIL
ncbi:MAG TPA: hypothetical protein VJ343_01350 [archaeon]|nr:hypothetical protein [archaeon]